MAVMSGSSAFEHVFGASLFEYLAAHPDDAEVFNAGMTSGSAIDAAAVVAAYDFSRFDRLVDVGGVTVRCCARFCRQIQNCAVCSRIDQRSSRGRKLCGPERWQIDANSQVLISSAQFRAALTHTS
jgi:hypothetical protein